MIREIDSKGGKVHGLELMNGGPVISASKAPLLKQTFHASEVSYISSAFQESKVILTKLSIWITLIMRSVYCPFADQFWWHFTHSWMSWQIRNILEFSLGSEGLLKVNATNFRLQFVLRCFQKNKGRLRTGVFIFGQTWQTLQWHLTNFIATWLT